MTNSTILSDKFATNNICVRDVVLVDNRDSFTYNLLEELSVLGARVRVVRNNLPVARLRELLQTAHAPLLVLSPGPGTPAQAGLCLDYIDAFCAQTAILGICLGHQALVQAFGGSVVRAAEAMHGECSIIRHNGDAIFTGLPAQLAVARYHSLVAGELPNCLLTIAETVALTNSASAKLCMAVRHRTLALVGLQFHPESILTAQGRAILRNVLTQLGVHESAPAHTSLARSVTAGGLHARIA